MRELYNALPDDRPVTAICLIEEVNKCPQGFVVVAKSYDQDLDADLGRDGIFGRGRNAARYLCISKSEGNPQLVIDSLCIINEKDLPPNGFTVLSKTHGSENKAWKKRQLCYRLSEKNSVLLAITDIILLSKAKKSPEGFTLAGEINSCTVCYKSSPIPSASKAPSRPLPPLPSAGNPAMKPLAGSNLLQEPANPQNSKSPVRPAPLPPTSAPLPLTPAPLAPSPAHQVIGGSSNRNMIISSATLSGYTGLEGVPFTLGPGVLKLSASAGNIAMATRPRFKTANQVNAEYQYSFSTEREATLRL